MRRLSRKIKLKPLLSEAQQKRYRYLNMHLARVVETLKIALTTGDFVIGGWAPHPFIPSPATTIQKGIVVIYLSQRGTLGVAQTLTLPDGTQITDWEETCLPLEEMQDMVAL